LIILDLNFSNILSSLVNNISLYFSVFQVGRVEERRGGYRFLMEKHEGKTHLGKLKPRWDDLQELG